MTLSSIKIRSFRSFSEFTVPRLSRVNLFVGRNCCGKTSFLEAAEFLSSGGDPRVIVGALERRAEFAQRNPNDRGGQVEFAHVFHNHDFLSTPRMVIEGFNNNEAVVSCEVSVVDAPKQMDLLGEHSDTAFAARFYSSSLPDPIEVGINEDGSLNATNIRRQLHRYSEEYSFKPVQFVDTTSYRASIGDLWNLVVLTEEESRVVEALRLIEPKIDRLAFLEIRRLSPRMYSESGIYVKLSGEKSRTPLGSMGEGLERLLRLALAITLSQGSSVLIDEIDTGLHYSVLEDIWRMIVETSRRLDVQVFATTHSQDCIRSLATLQEKYPNLAEDISLHRIEAGQSESIPYSAEELAIAARHDMELR